MYVLFRSRAYSVYSPAHPDSYRLLIPLRYTPTYRHIPQNLTKPPRGSHEYLHGTLQPRERILAGARGKSEPGEDSLCGWCTTVLCGMSESISGQRYEFVGAEEWSSVEECCGHAARKSSRLREVSMLSTRVYFASGFRQRIVSIVRRRPGLSTSASCF